jgi:hypothetical protein
MPTDNQRVAGYIKPQVYDRFIEFCEEKEITVSKGLNIIIAEYFGMEDDLDDRLQIGGVTLAEFEELKKKVNELSNILNNLQSDTLNQKAKEIIDDIPSDILNNTQLAERCGISRSYIQKKKRECNAGKITQEDYLEWISSKDPDGKRWWFKDNENFLYDKAKIN